MPLHLRLSYTRQFIKLVHFIILRLIISSQVLLDTDQKNRAPNDLDMIPIVDTPEEVLKIIKDYYEGKGELEPNIMLE